MFEEKLARIRTHRNNIHRYRGLLRTAAANCARAWSAPSLIGAATRRRRVDPG
jgi:hypothetical protein